MGDERLYYTFRQDTRGFIDKIKELLLKLESSGYSLDIINEIFRCIHSIKSEADYLDFSEISKAAHDMESSIEPLRRGEEGSLFTEELIEFCSTTIEKIESLLSFTEPPATGQRVETGKEEFLSPADIDEQKNKAEKYSDFEMLLLKEAYVRGEKLFEVSFSISAREVMKYPRFYLAMNNLELHHNVIKMDPGPDEINESVPDRVRVILTSVSDENKIGSDIAVDQIEDISIRALDFETEFKNIPREESEKDESPAKSQDRIINVDASEIDAISDYVSQIKGRLSGLSSAFSEKVGHGKLESDLAGLERISEGIENLMINLKTVDFNSYFSSYKKTVSDIASRLGKQVELHFDENSARIDREFADYIAEPILQLLRNAVAHGIEEPAARENKGKNKTGRIDISIIKDGGDIIISVEDDGGGIKNEILKDISTEVIVGDEAILKRLVTPGFTTHSDSAQYAGRGVGLDLVKSRIEKRNGRLELKNKPGAGCEFTLVFTDKSDEDSYIVVRSGNRTFAIRNAGTADIMQINKNTINEREGRFYFGPDELFSYLGRVKDIPGSMDDSIQGIRITYEGSGGMIVFDEPLFEIDLKKSSCSTGSETDKYLSEFKIDGKRTDYDILRPEVLFS